MTASIKGTKQSDPALNGTSGNDKIQGKGGNDTITGGQGNDSIDGGKGIDTAVYNGSYGDYAISFDGTGNLKITVADSVSGRDGTDALKHVEWLQFSDALVDVGNNVTHYSQATIGGAAVQGAGDPQPGKMWFGTGNTATNFNIATLNNQDIELGLKIKFRSGPDIVPTTVDGDGTAHYIAPAGLQTPSRAAWNFDYVVNTAVDGSTSTLSDFTFKMVITQTSPTNVVDTEVFTLNAATHTWLNETFTAGFAGDDFTPTYANPNSATVPAMLYSQVAGNSVNLGFLASAFGPVGTSTLAGNEYDIQLQAFDDVQLIGVVHDVVTLA